MGGRGARHLVRLVRLAMLLRGFLGDEEGLDHGGVEPAPRLHGDRPEGRPGGARRLAAARRADRPDRLLRRHRRRGDGVDPPVPFLHAEPSSRAAAGRRGAGRIGRRPGAASRRDPGEADAGLQHEEGGRDHRRSRQLLRDQGAVRPAGNCRAGAARRPQRRHHRQQSGGRGRGALGGGLPQDRRFHGAVRQLQHSARSA